MWGNLMQRIGRSHAKNRRLKINHFPEFKTRDWKKKRGLNNGRVEGEDKIKNGEWKKNLEKRCPVPRHALGGNFLGMCKVVFIKGTSQNDARGTGMAGPTHKQERKVPKT